MTPCHEKVEVKPLMLTLDPWVVKVKPLMWKWNPWCESETLMWKWNLDVDPGDPEPIPSVSQESITRDMQTLNSLTKKPDLHNIM